MANEQIAQTIELAEPDYKGVPEPVKAQVSPLVRRFLARKAELAKHIEDLKTRELTPMTARLAVEWDAEAKEFEEEVIAAFEPTVSVLHSVHRATTGVRGSLIEYVKPLRNLCSSLISQWKTEQAREAAKNPQPAARAEILDRTDAVLAGVATVKKWIGTVESKEALVKHIAENPGLMFLLTVEQGELDKYATKMKGEIKLPGVKIEEKIGTRNRN